MATIELTGSVERRPGRFREAAWDLAAASLIPLASFSSFLNYRGYDILQPETFLACGVLIAITAVAVAVVSLQPDRLRPLVFLGLVVVFLYMENEFYLPGWLMTWLTNLVGPDMALNLRTLIYVLPIAVVFFILRDKLSVILVAVFGTMVIASLVLPQRSFEAVTIVEQSPPALATAGDKPPPLLHLIIDQQIGVDGLPEEIAGTPAMRQALLDFYDDYGFRLYTGAYTHFPATLESIPDLLNGALEPSARHFVELRDDKVHVETNAWFEALRTRGYDIEVIQSDYMNYCSSTNNPVSYCYTYSASDVREIQHLDLTAWEKAELLLYTFFDEDYVLLSRTARVAWYGGQKLSEKVGQKLPDWDRRSLNLSPIPSLAALDVVGKRLETIEPGKAIFAHILLPHDPFILDEDCQPKSDFELWKPRESALWWYRVKSDPQRRLARYDEFYKQVTCLHRKMGQLLDGLAQRGILDDATVIIHGDHGSRISLIEPITGSEHLMTPRDIIDSVSTVFAIRGAGIEPGAVDGQHSIQALFAELALGRDDVTDHNDIFLKSQQDIIAPNQIRLPMVPYHDGE